MTIDTLTRGLRTGWAPDSLQLTNNNLEILQAHCILLIRENSLLKAASGAHLRSVADARSLSNRAAP